jgi:tripartite-type tricarboxylate transporter receptor subunit TctC
MAVSALATALVFTMSPGPRAQGYPDRPIKVLVPLAAASAIDIVARIVGEKMGAILGQSFYVEDQPGAAGMIAMRAAARAAPDGYTFLFTNTSGLAVNLVSFKRLTYDPTRDFAPVAMVCSLGPQMLSVNAALPPRSLAEFLAYAKANQGRLSLAYDTTAGAAAFAAKLINKRSGLGLIEVPYRTSAQMVQDTASGMTQVMISSIAAARSVVDAGKVRQLAVTSATRFPGLPDVPTVSERVPGVVMNGWFAVVAPAGTPPEAVQRLNREIGAYLKGPDVQPRLLDFGLATEGAGTPESTAEFIIQEQVGWQALAKDLDIEPQ